MRSLTQPIRLSLIVLSVSGIGVWDMGRCAAAAPPAKAIDAYVAAYTQMGKSAAVIFAQENTRANAQNKALSTWADAQYKLLTAKAGWITAVAEANGTNAKTLQTLEQVRSAALDNNLKVANTFYEKRKLYDGYQGLHTRKRPTKDDLIRYSRVSAPKRPAKFQVEPTRGTIYWPEALLAEDFSDSRIRLDSLFSQRKAGGSVSNGNASRQMQVAAVQMREQLRSKVRQMNPAEYIAARKFLDSLAYEARFAANIEGVAAN